MNIQKLYDSVAQLGFEDTLDSDDRFFQAANRAIYQINRIRPAISSIQISHHPLKNKVFNNSFDTIKKTENSIETQSVDGAKAYYFECDGNGVAYIELYNSATGTFDIIKTIEMTAANTRTFVVYKGFIKYNDQFITGQVRLRFDGDYAYCVKNIAIYDNIYSDNESDIPAFGEYYAYDIKELAVNFLRLCNSPIKEEQSKLFLNSNYHVEQRKIVYLPYLCEGEFSIFYERKIVEITSEDKMDETEIDLDEDLAAICPLLTAAYIWLDDEQTKADYYMSLYREQEQRLLARESELTPVTIKNNGWA